VCISGEGGDLIQLSAGPFSHTFSPFENMRITTTSLIYESHEHIFIKRTGENDRIFDIPSYIHHHCILDHNITQPDRTWEITLFHFTHTHTPMKEITNV